MMKVAPMSHTFLRKPRGYEEIRFKQLGTRCSAWQSGKNSL